MVLANVGVPKEFAPVFEAAEQLVSRYFATMKREPSKGMIDIGGERYVMVRAAALSVEFFELVRALFGAERRKEADDFARNILFDLAHAIGKVDARAFQEKAKLGNPIERLSAGPVRFSHSGWAFVEISPASSPTPDENFYLIYDHPYSFESDAWIKVGKRSDFPACIMNAGYSSGWCEESFGLPLVASEILCRARGDDCCRFIMAPPSRIEERIRAYAGAEGGKRGKIDSYEIPDFFSRKRMEERLRESEARYRMLVESTNDIPCALDENGTILYVGPQAERYGFSPQEITGKPFLLQVHPEDRAGVMAAFLRAKERQEEFAMAFRVLNPAGGVFWLEEFGKLRHDPDGTFRGLNTILRDVTDRKRVEEELRGSEAKFKGLFDYMTSCVAVFEAVDGGGNFIFKDFNPAAEKTEGVAREEVLGKRVTEVFPGVRAIGIFDVFRNVWRSGQPGYLPDAVYKDERGRQTWRESWVYKLPGGEIVAVYNDITDRKRAEEALREKVDELERFDRLMVGRETRIIEMKEEVNRLLKELGRQPRYKV